MTRLMGDATHANVAALAQVPSLQLVAGYVTGSPGIQWTTGDWARFPGILHVTIDQAFIGSPVSNAIVRDVEPGAWTPENAVNFGRPWTPARPTIYCDRNDLTRVGGVLASGWKGDLWLAIPGWQPGQPLPPAPGCNIVAVQNNFSVNAYDLSVVLDPAWPLEASVLTSYQPGSVGLIYSPTGQLQIYGTGQDSAVYLSDLNPDFTTSNTRQVSAPLTFGP